MPSLAELSDYYPQTTGNGLPVEQPYNGINIRSLNPEIVTPFTPQSPVTDEEYWSKPVAPMPELSSDNVMEKIIKKLAETSFSEGHPLGNQLFGTGGEERYQLWPEKVVREALSVPHDVKTGALPTTSIDPETGEVVTSPQLIAGAQAMSALAGTGGLAGTGEGVGAALGAGPMLRPALKFEGKIYKAPIKDAENPLGFGAEHSDAIPAHLADDFYKKAMSGEDINHYDFGFINHKGQFLKREDALDYGIKEGLIDPQNAKYGTLTSTMLADSSKPGAAIESLAKTQPFYSALEHNVNQISQAKMTGEQWLGTLKNKPGVKPEELDWTGTKEFLQSKGKEPVTKAELQEHLANNKVEIKDVDKGELSDKAILEQSKIKQEDWDKMSKSQKEVIRTNFPNNPTKYHSYQLPGGENYREKLLTLPPTKNVLPQFKVINEHGQVESTWTDKAKADAWAAKNNYTVREDKPITLNGGYKSSHWDEPNILAHVRMNDRMIDGKKSLHLEEIQSDMMQAGRDKGFKSGFHPEDFDIKELPDKKGFELRYKGNPDQFGKKENFLIDTFKTKGDANAFIRNGEIPERLGNVLSKEGMRRGEIPDAPFEKNWHELALKRMIREAAEKGYDRLSWTPGEAQAARYDLSKSVSTVVYKDGKLTAIGPSGQHVINNEIVGKDKLADYIGKEAAEKLLKQEPHNGAHTLQGEQLKIGGEGMKGFYDQIIPKALEKISGEKVKSAILNSKNYEGWKLEGDKLISSDGKQQITSKPIIDQFKAEQQKIHYIDLPQQLKDKAMSKGFPLFSGNYMYSPVVGNPFQQDKK